MGYTVGAFVGTIVLGYFFEFFCDRFDKEKWWWNSKLEFIVQLFSALCSILVLVWFLVGLIIAPFAIYSCFSSDELGKCLLTYTPSWF